MKMTVRVVRKIRGQYKRPTHSYNGMLGSGEGEGEPKNPNEHMFVVVSCGVVIVGLVIGVIIAAIVR
ncbi:MAG: hypothetical protein JWP89_2662 [Schlesneria sp.]|nr:hypothetical protein [Schlesneria sp.]